MKIVVTRDAGTRDDDAVASDPRLLGQQGRDADQQILDREADDATFPGWYGLGLEGGGIRNPDIFNWRIHGNNIERRRL